MKGGLLGFLPVLWIGIIIECFQSFGKFTLQEMKDAIADTNNSAPGKDRLSYNMFKHLSEKNT
jgi:hypothetical protein